MVAGLHSTTRRGPGTSPTLPAMAESMLIVTQVAPYIDGPAGVHGTLPQAAVALSELADLAGLDPVQVADVRDVSPDRLAAARVLALFTIGETPWSDGQKEAVTTAWRTGRLRVLGVHSATDASHTWPEYGLLMGARFDGHPWTQDFAIDVVDRNHPATAHLDEQWDWRDEVYLFRSLRPEARVLLRLANDQVPNGRTPECGFPLAWCIEDGAARSFYTALGHFHLAWELPVYLRHLAGGLAWLEESA
jgi:uncharacterized protein